MKNKTYSVDLTLKELKLMDGKVSDKVQAVIDKAKQENSYGFELPVMNEILRKSEETGELKWKYKTIRECEYCDKKYDYHRYPRSGKYHSKGDKNYNKPIYYQGIEFNQGFVTIQGHGDICCDCEKKYNVIHRLIDYIIDNNLKIQIQKNDYKPSKYLKDKIQMCYECGKEIKESEMGGLPTVMRDGYYKGICPYCGAKELPFGKSHKLTNKFDVIFNPQFKDEVQNITQLIKEYNKEVNDKNEEGINIYQSKRDNNTFIVEENKWKNGYRKIIVFNVYKKTFKIGVFWEDRADLFVNILKDNNYKLVD
ncbi:TPA: hypothetical protein ACXDAZ_002523 [Clostridium botulinum]